MLLYPWYTRWKAFERFSTFSWRGFDEFSRLFDPAASVQICNTLVDHIDIRLLSSDQLPDCAVLDHCGSSAFWLNGDSDLRYFLDD